MIELFKSYRMYVLVLVLITGYSSYDLSKLAIQFLLSLLQTTDCTFDDQELCCAVSG